MMSVSSSVSANTLVTSPPRSVQARNFSKIQAAGPAGESVSAYASVRGSVLWIAWYAASAERRFAVSDIAGW